MANCSGVTLCISILYKKIENVSVVYIITRIIISLFRCLCLLLIGEVASRYCAIVSVVVRAICTSIPM